MSTTSERGTRPAASRPADVGSAVTGVLPPAPPPAVETGTPHVVETSLPPVETPTPPVETSLPPAEASPSPSVDLALPVVVLGPVPRGSGTAGLGLVVAVLALALGVRAPFGTVVALAVGALALAVLALATARPRRNGRARAVVAVVVAVAALVVASLPQVAAEDADDVVTAQLALAGAGPSPVAETAAPGLVELRSTQQAAPFAPALVETAAGPLPGRTGAWWYVAVVENATPGYVVPASAYEVVALGPDGAVLDRDVTAELELWSGRTALTGTFDVGDADVEGVEVRGPQAHDGPRTGTPGGLRPEGVTARTWATTTVHGTVRSTLGRETPVHVTVVARDAQEQVTGSASVDVGPVPARGRAQFEVRFDRVLPPATRYEVYARP